MTLGQNQKSLIGAFIGTALEYYDFMLFMHFLIVLSPLFFPNEDPLVSRLMGMASWAVGFLMRPFGGVIFGHYGDRWGRKNALALAIILISLPTFIIGILPTYAQIGIAAPIILLLCRLLQSFCLGGESSGALVFTAENAPEGKKALMGGLLNTGYLCGALLGGLLGYFCTKPGVPEWGWRIPFIFGGLLGFFGFYIRRSIQESPAFLEMQKKKQPLKVPLLEVLKTQKLHLLTIFGICAGVQAPFYTIYVYINDVLKNSIKMETSSIMLNSTGLMLFEAILLPLTGMLADKVGNRKIMGAFSLALSILSYPLFSFIQGTTDYWRILVVQVVLIISGSGIISASLQVITEIFPVQMRYSALAFGWSLGIIVFAGFLPLTSLYLVNLTGNQKMPAVLLTGCGLMCFYAVCRYKYEHIDMNSNDSQPPLKIAA